MRILLLVQTDLNTKDQAVYLASAPPASRVRAVPERVRAEGEQPRQEAREVLERVRRRRGGAVRVRDVEQAAVRREVQQVVQDARGGLDICGRG